MDIHGEGGRDKAAQRNATSNLRSGGFGTEKSSRVDIKLCFAYASDCGVSRPSNQTAFAMREIITRDD